MTYSYEETIQNILHHIDNNLSGHLNAETLAGIAGFSTYHFCRVFQWHVGYSVMEYVRLRRLAFAVSELSSGRKIIDIALDYGFETHSGFSKAFKRHYGVPPEIYRIHASKAKPPLPNILRMHKIYHIGGIIMEPKFVTKGEIKLAGYAIKTRNEEGQNSTDIPAFWLAYMSDGRQQQLHQSAFVKNSNEYGACFPVNPDNGAFEYVIGVEVKDGVEIPSSFHTCQLPPATYAVFSSPPSTPEEFSNNIQGTWQYIMDEWFPKSGYEYADGCVDFEFYDEKNMENGACVCDIHIPVVKKDM